MILSMRTGAVQHCNCLRPAVAASGQAESAKRRDVVVGSGRGKAAEHDPSDAARRGGQFGSDRADRDARGTVRRKPIDAGRDRGKRDRRQTVRGGEIERRCDSTTPASSSSP